jgi:uncharacterized protein
LGIVQIDIGTCASKYHRTTPPVSKNWLYKTIRKWFFLKNHFFLTYILMTLEVPKKTSIQIVLKVFRAIQDRDENGFVLLLHPDFEIHWPESLPYGGNSRDPKPEKITWQETWGPLQPTEAERKMDPQIIAATEENVVVLWRQRGITSEGIRFDGEVLGRYRIREGKLFSAKMYYFDTIAVGKFLAETAVKETSVMNFSLQEEL